MRWDKFTAFWEPLALDIDLREGGTGREVR
jgi:hypothetical protein